MSGGLTGDPGRRAERRGQGTAAPGGMGAVLPCAPPGAAAPGEGEDEPAAVPPEIAAQLVRALDRSPSTFTVLIGRDLKTRWSSSSSSWVSNTDPTSRWGV